MCDRQQCDCEIRRGRYRALDQHEIGRVLLGESAMGEGVRGDKRVEYRPPKSTPAQRRHYMPRPAR